jgi:hypothetical protein
MERHWQFDGGRVTSREFDKLTYIKAPVTVPSIGWLTYLKDKALLSGLPPSVRQIPCGEGVLIVTSEEFSSPDNPQHVAQALALRDVLQKLLPGKYMPIERFDTTVLLEAYWSDARPLTLRQYAETTWAFLRELGEFHPVFARLAVADEKRGAEIAIAEDGGNLEGIALERARDKKAPPGAYTKLDEHGHLTPESLTAERGFTLSFQNMAYDPDSKLLTIKGGAEHYNRLIICLPVVRYPEFAQADFASRLYRIVEKHWHPREGLVSYLAFNGLNHAPPGRIGIGWLTYVADKDLLSRIPPGVRQIPCGEGVLIVTSEELSSPNNPQHIAQAQALRDALQGR